MATSSSWHRLLRDALEPGDAADRQQGDVGRRHPEPPGRQGVPQLVQDHAAEDRQDEPDALGACARRRRRPTVRPKTSQAIRIRNVQWTKIGMPAIRPSLMDQDIGGTRAGRRGGLPARPPSRAGRSGRPGADAAGIRSDELVDQVLEHLLAAAGVAADFALVEHVRLQRRRSSALPASIFGADAAVPAARSAP